MGVSVRGHSDRHLHSPCPQCGYATRYKQWPIKCGCSNAQRQKIRTELHKIDYSHIPPLRIADRYAAGRPQALRHGGLGGE